MRAKKLILAIVGTVITGSALGCGDDQSGAGGMASVTPGLWIGEMESATQPGDRWGICLFVSTQGDRLIAAEACSLDGSNQPFSAQLIVENAGVSAGDEPCGFQFQMTDEIPLDPNGSFTSGMESGPSTIVLAGFFGSDEASGTANANGVPIIEECTLMQWTARPVVE